MNKIKHKVNKYEFSPSMRIDNTLTFLSNTTRSIKSIHVHHPMNSKQDVQKVLNQHESSLNITKYIVPS